MNQGFIGLFRHGEETESESAQRTQTQAASRLPILQNRVAGVQGIVQLNK
jgi:hypothetical protein